MVKWFNLLDNSYKNSKRLYITVFFIAITASVLLLIIGTISPFSWILWLSLAFFLAVVFILYMDLRYCYKAELAEKFHSLLFLFVTIAVFLTWVPSIVWEKKLFNLLEDKSITMNYVQTALERAKKPDPNEETTEKNARLENVDRLLRFPTSEVQNGDTLIRYGYTTLSKSVADAPYPRAAIAIVLSFATGLAFTLISLKSWTDKYRNFKLKLLLMASSFFIIGGIFPYLLSGEKTGNIVMVGFYAGLFTWVFNLHFLKIKEEYVLNGDVAKSSEQADAIYRYYMRLLMFALGTFGLITVGLVFHVSNLMGEMYVLSRELRQHLFFFILLHDFYGTMILLVGVVLRLVQILEETVELYPHNGNKA